MAHESYRMISADRVFGYKCFKTSRSPSSVRAVTSMLTYREEEEGEETDGAQAAQACPETGNSEEDRNRERQGRA